MTRYFFDTYAIMEVFLDAEPYQEYLGEQAFTTWFNVAEVNDVLKRQIPAKKADKYAELASKLVTEVTLEDIQRAMDFRHENSGVSIPDAVGYCVAKRKGMKFLTGDEDFRDMDNVEFVK